MSNIIIHARAREREREREREEFFLFFFLSDEFQEFDLLIFSCFWRTNQMFFSTEILIIFFFPHFSIRSVCRFRSLSLQRVKDKRYTCVFSLDFSSSSFSSSYVYICIENMGQKHDACLWDDNDDEPTGWLDFESERRERKGERERKKEDGHLLLLLSFVHIFLLLHLSRSLSL